ncbi:MAG: DegV family EDD domain-containing protein [Labilithrix sp.]|nr:DegV family EDD domain-containing protein [Labilithrix sp.]
MRVFTNPCMNLSAFYAQRYSVVLTPQHLMAAGKAYDTRLLLAHSQIDALAEAPGGGHPYPYVVGTTAQEFTGLFVEHLPEDPEILVVTSSKRIIKTYQAAQAAADAIKSSQRFAGARVRVVDSTTTDVAAALLLMAAGESARAGMKIAEVHALVSSLRSSLTSITHLRELDRALAGGRIGFLRAWLANVLDLRPLLTFEGGELTKAGAISVTADRIAAIVEKVESRVVVRPGQKIWAAVAHGGVPADADALLEATRRRFDVAFSYVQPLSPSIYLHAGPGALVLAVMPVDPSIPTPPAMPR